MIEFLQALGITALCTLGVFGLFVGVWISNNHVKY